MFGLKKLVKSSRFPLQQVANGIEEKWASNEHSKITKKEVQIISVQLENFKLP